jgi:hypothetical protein
MTVLMKPVKIYTKTEKREKSLGRSRHRWEDNIKTDLTGIGWDDVGWIHLRTSGGLL